MSNLDPVYGRFIRRIDTLEDIFKGWAINASTEMHEKDLMFLEGLVSSLWQHWSLFCRRIIILSALGCTTRSGTIISCCVSPAKWERISYIAYRKVKGSKIFPLVENSDLKKEPTWGDVTKAQEVIGALSTENAGMLGTCLGSISRGPIHVQRVRNAAAHRNCQNLSDVKDLRPYYIARPIYHPVQVVTWTDPSSRDYAFVSWLEDIRLIADLMTR